MPGFMKKTMVYLGLLDDEYDEYDDIDDRAPRGMAPALPRTEPAPEEPDERSQPASMGRIRTLPRETAPAAAPSTFTNPSFTTRSTSVRPMPVDAAKVTVIAPSRFGDAKDIADCVKENRPVIVNLQVADRDLQRRMIDFCSGVTYAVGGEMEKVADQVFLLAPTNVKVSDEERQRLQERGYGRG
jgi:cell division inhibitor SepF